MLSESGVCVGGESYFKKQKISKKIISCLCKMNSPVSVQYHGTYAPRNASVWIVKCLWPDRKDRLARIRLPYMYMFNEHWLDELRAIQHYVYNARHLLNVCRDKEAAGSHGFCSLAPHIGQSKQILIRGACILYSSCLCPFWFPNKGRIP